VFIAQSCQGAETAQGIIIWMRKNDQHCAFGIDGSQIHHLYDLRSNIEMVFPM
jgi:hypothetical protein